MTIESIGFGVGYDTFDTWEEWIAYTTSITNGGSPAPVTMTAIRTWMPAQPAIASISATPPTPSQINYLMNKGWNSWSVSIDQILPGKFMEYTLSPGISASFVGLGRVAQAGDNINTFQHGILVDNSGIWAFESGVKVEQIRTTYSGSTIIRIYRQSDNTIVYLAITGTESLIHKSTVPAMQIPLYAHGMLYSSSDTMNSATITVGEVKFGSV